jgi:hypothetical protein
MSDLFGCETAIDREVKSPYGDRAAVVFQIDCGATTPFNTQVSIVRGDADAFSAKRYPPIFIVRGRHDLGIEWLAGDLIKIEVPPEGKVYMKAGAAGGIKVIYE